jgi:hypothetical protein
MPAFSIPNYPSLTSTTPNELPILFVPNVPYLRRFVDGELGIAKKIVETFNKKALKQVKGKDALLVYTKVSGADIGPNIDQFFSNGKFTPPSKLSVKKNSNNLGGLDALERALITSIFETQKPYIEIAKLVIDHFVIIEDIVAHVLGLIGRSKKPRGNPRALGYQGSQAGGGAGGGMDALQKIADKPAPRTTISDANSGLNRIANEDFGPLNITIPNLNPLQYITQSVLYSTGDFREDVIYDYIYKDYFEAFDPIIGTISTAINDEPDDVGKKDVFVLGIYDKDWELVNKQTAIEKLPWIEPKYTEGPWPQVKPGVDFDYLWWGKIFGFPLFENVGGAGTPTQIPGIDLLPNIDVNWEIKVYRDIDGPFLEIEGERKAIKEGQKAIALSSQKTISLLTFFKDFYLDYTLKELDKAMAGDPALGVPPAPPTYLDENGVEVNTRQQTINDLTALLSDFGPTGNLVIQLEGLLENNFMNLSSRYTPNLLDVDKFKTSAAYAFKPKKLTVAGLSDQVWVDVEVEYDMKIIKCDATRNITFRDTVGAPEKAAIIRRFIKKNITIIPSENQTFGVIASLEIPNNPNLKVGRIFNNLPSISIDFYLDNPTVALPTDDKTLISVQETGQIITLSQNVLLGLSPFPLDIIRDKIPSSFRSFRYINDNIKYRFEAIGAAPNTQAVTGTAQPKYKLAGYFENIYAKFYKRNRWSDGSYMSSYVFIDHDNNSSTPNIKDTMELLVGSADYNRLLIEFPNEQELSRRIEDIPFTIQQINADFEFERYKVDNVDVNTEGTNFPLYNFDFFQKRTTVYHDTQRQCYVFVGCATRMSTLLGPRIPTDDGVLRQITFDVINDNIINQTDQTLPFLVRIDDMSTGTAKSRIISAERITNNQLRIPGPLATGPYGSPNVDDQEPSESVTQQVEQIYRFQRRIDDVETFYIVEAVLKSQNQNPLESAGDAADRAGSGGSGSGGRGGGSYTWKNIFGVIPKFIRLAIRIATKLFPAIQQFLNLIRNPASFVTDIIIAKLGDDFGTDVPKFGFFSKEFLDQLKQLKQLVTSIKNNRFNPQNLQVARRQLKLFLNSSLLKNYVFVDDLGRPKFLLDGAATIKLFGDAPILQGLPSIVFGIETNLGSLATPEPKVPFKLIFGINRVGSGSNKSLPAFLGITDDNLNRQIAASALVNSALNPGVPFSVKNEIVTGAGGVQTLEEVSIEYSTGAFKAGVDYTYIYLTEEVVKLLMEAEALESNGDSDSIKQAIALLEEAQSYGTNNKLINEKLAALRKLEAAFSSQPIFDFMLNLVCLPLKVIIGIIKFILNFFKSLTNPFSLPGQIVNFLTFKWMLDFFSPISPNSMFAMAGILFDIEKFFSVWLPGLQSGTKLSYDMNEIISLPWVTWPTFELEQFRAISKVPIPILILSTILCLIEAIINCFIDFIWAILGLVEPLNGKWIVIKPPYINLCKDLNLNPSAKDIAKILDLSISDITPVTSTASVNTAKNPSVTDEDELDDNTFNFLFDVDVSDGRKKTSLNQEELDKFIEANEGVQFKFNF